MFYDLDVLLPEVSITIAVDQTSSHTFEISSVVGIVTGTATINGQPPEGGQHFRICGETSSSVCQSTDAVGHFRLLLPAGSGTVRLSEASELDTFSFTVTAGQTTEVGTINFEVEVEQTGEIEALFEYLDQPLSKYGAACQLGVKITAIEGDFQRTNEFDSGGSGGCSGRMLFTNIPVGDYRLDLFYGNSDEYLLPEIQVNVSADHVTSHTFDISVVVGVVAGTITVNGQAPEQGRFTVCGSTTGQACQTVDTNGRFALLLPPGNGIGSIEEGSGFGFTVTAGQTTGTFMTEIDPAEYFVSGVPQGTEVCIANEDFSSCQPFESSRARFTSTVRAFAQPKPASILVIFENVPAGAYQITLRVPGGDTYVVGNTSFGIDSAPTDTDALNLTFIPCETRACESPHSTKVDGATATWTIDSLDDSTDESTTSTATLSDGIANTTTDPLPLGTYRVCLDPTLTGGSSGDVRIAEEAICEQVEITEENATSSISVSFEQKLTDRSDSESENGQTHNTIRQLVQFLVFLLALLFSF